MDFDSSSKFIASLAKFLQSLCNGYVNFDKGVEVIGHIYLNVDSDTNKKIDYVLNEKVCKNDSSVTFISNSFHAAPAEKPVPKSKDDEKQKEVENSGNGSSVPSSTNVGTIGSSYRRSQDSFTPGSKRPGSPLNRQGRSPFKSSRSNFSNSDEYQGDDGGGEEDNVYFEDQKPILDSEGGLVKEEALQNNYSYNASGPPSGDIWWFYLFIFVIMLQKIVLMLKLSSVYYMSHCLLIQVQLFFMNTLLDKIEIKSKTKNDFKSLKLAIKNCLEKCKEKCIDLDLSCSLLHM